jgi:hypothetical protein
MKNITTRTEGSKLIIEVDMNQDFGKSSTGKSTIVASSAGFIAVRDDVKLNLTVIRK